MYDIDPKYKQPEFQRKYAKYLGVGWLFMVVFIIITMLAVNSYINYEQYPKYQRYPIKLMTIKQDYQSFWDYLNGNKQVIFMHDGYIDTSYVREYHALKPIYDEPNL